LKRREYLDVQVREGQIILTPVRIQRGDAVRAKLAELGLGGSDVADAVRWARASAATPMAAEPGKDYPTKSKVRGAAKTKPVTRKTRTKA